MDRKSLTVLVIEDNIVMLKMYHPMLERLGFKKVLTANNGKEAWEALNQEGTTVDLIVSDLVMPKMDGSELLNMIRGSDRLWETPFIMISVEENKGRLVGLGSEVDAYLLKPFTPVTLEAEIDRALQKKFNPSPYQTAFRQGRSLLAQGEALDEALQAFQAAISLDPGEADPYYFSALINERQGQSAKAKLFLEKCIVLKPFYPKAYDLLATILRREKDFVAERDILLRIDKLAPYNVERNVKLALACARLRDLDGVRNALKVATRHAAEADLDTFEKAFRIYLQCGMHAEAEVVYKKYVDPGLENPRLLNKFGLFFKAVKSYERAIVLLERIVHIWRTVKNHGIPPEDMAVYYFNLAVAHVEQANTMSDPAAKQAGYQTAEKLANRAMDCDLTHEDAGKLYRWLTSRNA